MRLHICRPLSVLRMQELVVNAASSNWLVRELATSSEAVNELSLASKATRPSTAVKNKFKDLLFVTILNNYRHLLLTFQKNSRQMWHEVFFAGRTFSNELDEFFDHLIYHWKIGPDVLR